jgi:hypothetical protein
LPAHAGSAKPGSRRPRPPLRHCPPLLRPSDENSFFFLLKLWLCAGCNRRKKNVTYEN